MLPQLQAICSGEHDPSTRSPLPNPEAIPLAVLSGTSTFGLSLNFLAHLLLAGPDDASRIGNLLGDFARGTPESLVPRYPPEVVAGIVMHRKLDRFTDDHPAFHEARGLLASGRRRFAGIIVDVIFDHFLSIRWGEFSDLPLNQFVSDIYASFDRHPTWLGDELPSLLPRIKEDNWLLRYGSIAGIELTFQLLSRRSPRLGPIAGAGEDFNNSYRSFDLAFQQFFPDAQQYAAKMLEAG